MTDAHCHVRRGETRHIICEPCDVVSAAPGDAVFLGFHPWYLEGFDADALRSRLSSNPGVGVGEIGMDRLRDRAISSAMRGAFEAQLAIAAEFSRPVVLHGAKCWGEVFRAAAKYAGRIPAFLFHGFSRSGGLVSDIARINGFISIGPALLNDYAVNYRELAKSIPLDMLLVESDATPENAAEAPSVAEVAAKLAELRGIPLDALAAALEENASRFLKPE